MHRKNYLIIILSLYQLSCTTDSGYTIPNKDIIPLTIGNQWIYDTKSYDSTLILMGTLKDTMKVIKDTTFNNIKWYWIYYRLLGNISYYAAQNNTIGYVVRNVDRLIDYEVVVFKYPGRPGDIYSVSIPFADSVYTYQKTIISTDTSITVPSGKYTCYLFYNQRIKLNDHSEINEAESFISPEYGLIRNNYFNTTKFGLKYIAIQSDLVQLSLK